MERSRSSARAARIQKLKVERDLERLDKIWILQKVGMCLPWLQSLICGQYFITLDGDVN